MEEQAIKRVHQQVETVFKMKKSLPANWRGFTLISKACKGFTLISRACERGFTLIELLIVIVIIGILMSVLLVSYQGTRRTARDGKRKADLEQIRSAGIALLQLTQ